MANFDCKTCNLAFSKFNLYMDHMRKYHEADTFLCGGCKLRFANRLERDNHQCLFLQGVQNRGHSHDLDENRSTQAAADQQNNCAQKYSCSECFYTSPKKSNLKRHFSTKHETDNVLDKVPQPVFNCNICTYSSRFKSNVTRHREYVHKVVEMSEPSSNPDVYKVENSILSNTKTENRLMCEYCPYKASFKSNLCRHIKTKHSFRCSKCVFVCNSQLALDRHSTTHVRKQLVSIVKDSCVKYYPCAICNKRYVNRFECMRHEREVHNPNLNCPICYIKCDTITNLQTHQQTHFDSNGGYTLQQKDVVNRKTPILQKQCKYCLRTLDQRHFELHDFICDSCFKKHRKQSEQRKLQSGAGDAKSKKSKKSKKVTALNGAVSVNSMQISNPHDMLLLFSEQEKIISAELEQQLEERRGLKYSLSVRSKYEKEDEQQQTVYISPVFKATNQIITNSSEIEESISNSFYELYNSEQNFVQKGSNWKLFRILELMLNVSPYQPIAGSTFIATPKCLHSKKAIVNVQNRDLKCFLWSILASLYPAQHGCAHRVTSYTQYENVLNFNNIQFPVKLAHISKFEAQNCVSVNVFGFEEGEIFPLRVSTAKKDNHANLLLLSSEGDGNEYDAGKKHYCLITDMSRLLGDRTKHNGASFYCNYCLHSFSREDLLESHQADCTNTGLQRTVLPEESHITFKNYSKTLQCPIVIFADFESVLVELDNDLDNHSDPDIAFTRKIDRHEPGMFAYMITSVFGIYETPVITYSGEDCGEKFISCLLEEAEKINKLLSNPYPLIMTDLNERDFQQAELCFCCQKPLIVDRVRHHNHWLSGLENGIIVGNYIGATHNSCNLQLRYNRNPHTKEFDIPIFLHNAKCYDNHLILKTGATKFPNHKITCIASSTEKYISFKLGCLCFKDSYAFLADSLASLVDNLLDKGEHCFKYLRSEFGDEGMKYFLRKGVFPYNSFKSLSFLLQPHLPEKDEFFNVLTQQSISDDDYNYACKVWNDFNCTSMGQYCELYIKADVAQLADIWCNFSQQIYDTYGLSAANYYTAPGLSFDCMLKYTGCSIELLKSASLFSFIEGGVRGGLAIVPRKIATANNRHCESYDPSKATSWLCMVDANNLYGMSLSLPLPYSDYQWMDPDELANIDVTNLDINGSVGYIFNVSLFYDPVLHPLHNDFPLCPERMEVSEEMLSPWSRILKQKLKLGKGSTKLVATLMDKDHYTIHFANLQYCLKLGMKLKAIHRGVKFQQKCYMKPYIDLNTKLRTEASSSFEKSLYKLLINSVYGKTLENLRKRTNLQIVRSERQARKLSSRSHFKSFKIFDQNLIAVEMGYVTLKLCKPIASGMAVLDYSKLHIQRFHYNVIKEVYGSRSSLLLSDTDSLLYLIENEVDIVRDLKPLEQYYLDYSNIQTPDLHSNLNKKKLGFFKFEMNGEVLHQFCGLRSKCYSILLADKGEKTVAKGVPRSAIKNSLKHSMYLEAFHNDRVFMTQSHQIRSFNHQLYTVLSSKVSLSSFDDKAFYLESGKSLSFGNIEIEKVMEEYARNNSQNSQQ